MVTYSQPITPESLVLKSSRLVIISSVFVEIRAVARALIEGGVYSYIRVMTD